MTDSTTDHPAGELPTDETIGYAEPPADPAEPDDWETTQIAPIRVPSPSARPRRRHGWLVALIAVIIVAGFASALALLNVVNARRAALDASLRVGSCVKLVETPGGVTHQSAGCDESMSYTVATVSGTDAACPGPHYQSLAVTSGSQTVRTACLIQNLEANACYTISKTVDKLAKVQCGDPSADFKVAVRSDSLNEPGLCLSTQRYEGYPTPGRTYCLASPLGN